ncbi:MAG TPA: response regulator [Gemmataceae bacterium]|nr:response regulator [Gemmataceae bacterium]
MGSRRAMILVVEDNDTCREGLAVLLRGEGYEVIPLRHGQEALDYLEGAPTPDLILLDMLMPVLDGWNFLKRLRLPVPVIIATGTILTPECAASHGCVGFLRKPIGAEALFTEVRRCLN